MSICVTLAGPAFVKIFAKHVLTFQLYLVVRAVRVKIVVLPVVGWRYEHSSIDTFAGLGS